MSDRIMIDTNDQRDISLSKNFKLSEFECTCNLKHVKVDSRLVALLQKLRDRVGRAVRITSAYRCPARNRAVGSNSASQHPRGTACDIQVTGYTPTQIAKIAEEVGFDGIGIYRNFTHVDVRGTRARW